MALMAAARPLAALALILGGVGAAGQTPARAPSRPETPRATFVTVAPSVSLEVLDWGGTGRPVVLLAGANQTAHSFERFAPALAAFYHVYGITRRGWGASSAPATGYVASELADDVLAVIDSLGLRTPVLAGHSRAGQELSSIGQRHPERVAGLVYLDAAYGYAFYDATRGDFSVDVAELTRRLARLQDLGARGAVAAMDSVMTALLQQDLPALRRDLTEMQRILGQFPPGQRLLPPRRTGIAGAYDDGLERHTAITRRWVLQDSEAPGRFARGVPGAQVVIVPHATHFLFDSHPAEVLRAIRAFVDTLPDD